MTAQLPALPSKERLEKIVSWRETYGDDHNVVLPAKEAEALARYAMAGMEQEPVAGEARFKQERHWSPCTAGHVAMVMANREDWPNYEVRYLYAEPAAVSDYFAGLVSHARERADKAMRKFPQPNYVLNKVAEESGEVIKAVIHYTEGREEWSNVESEIIDNLAMLIRLVTEGDQVIGFTPPDACFPE